jgi:hypothetical protein
MGTRNITHVLGGLPTDIAAEDADLFGSGLVGSRPVSGDYTGDLWLLDDGAGHFILQRWSGSAWVNVTTFGPSGGSVDNRIARFDGTTGAVIQNSLVTVDDDGNVDNAEGQFNGNRHYNDSATNPTTPTPAEGDRYYNTSLEMEMRYDGARAKWLSVASETIEFGRNGNTAANAYYRSSDTLAFSSTDGRKAEWNGTIVGIGYTRTDTDSATFEVTADGTTVASLVSTALSGRDNALNGDFAQDSILGVRNATGGNVTSSVLGWVRIKWRA